MTFNGGQYQRIPLYQLQPFPKQNVEMGLPAMVLDMSSLAVITLAVRQVSEWPHQPVDPEMLQGCHFLGRSAPTRHTGKTI